MVFGWGKGRGRNDEVQAPVIREIPVSEVGPVLEAITREQSDRLIEQTRKLWHPVTHHIESLLRIATDLENDPLNTDDIDINIITAVKRGKKQVLDTIHKESRRRFPELESVQDVKEFNRLASQALNKVGNILGKQTRVIHIFAKKYAGKLKDILKRFTDDMEQSDRLLAGFVEFERGRDRVSELLAKLAADQESIGTGTEKTARLEELAARQQDELGVLDGKIGDFKSSPNYEKYLGIQRRLDLLKSKRSQTENDINNQTILISRPVSKYEYGSSLDREDRFLIEKFLSSPSEVFLPENRASIVTILNNIRKAVSFGHISVKEPEKTVGYIDDIISKVDGFIRTIDSLASEQKSLENRIKTLDLDVLEGYQRRRSKTHEDLLFSRSRIKALRAEIASLESGLPRHAEEMGSVLSGLGDARYAVVLDGRELRRQV